MTTEIPSSTDSSATTAQATPMPSTPKKKIVINGYPVLTPLTKPRAQSTSRELVKTVDQIDEHEMPAAVEKTSRWAGIFFGAAIVAMAVAAHCVYRSWKDRNPSLLIPALLWALVATIIGTAGEILDKKPKVETITGDMKASPSVAPRADFVPGQPVPIFNVGNTCFINATTQALMNDDQLPRVFKEICERARDRHRVFSEFLSLFSSQTILPTWIPRLWGSNKNEAPLMAVRKMTDVLAMLAQKKSRLGCGTPEFTETYPRIAALIHQFSEARKEADFPVVNDEDKELCQEFTRMKDDERITSFFSEERSAVARKIAGFEAYLNLMTSYERAMHDGLQTVSLGGGLFSSHSSIENIRNLIQGASGYSQEDVGELLECLVQYIRPDDYPETFVHLTHQQTWAECPVQQDETKKADDEAKLAERIEKHRKSTGPHDLLTSLPDNNVTESPAEPYCILRIQDVLTKDEDGQKLLDQTLGVRVSQSSPEESIVYLKSGKVKLYYAVKEQWVIKKPPARFILQLMRFKCDGTVMQKVNCDVNMPLEITMAGQLYELKSVVVHHGLSAENGHYTAMLKKTIEGKATWWYASDNHVTSTSVKEDLATALKKGYLYFYVKKAAGAV